MSVLTVLTIASIAGLALILCVAIDSFMARRSNETPVHAELRTVAFWLAAADDAARMLEKALPSLGQHSGVSRV